MVQYDAEVPLENDREAYMEIVLNVEEEASGNPVDEREGC